MRAKAFSQSGFTLIEVIAAFSVLVIALTSLSRAVSTGIQSELRSGEAALALCLAQSKMAQLGVERSIEDEPLSGVFENGMIWNLLLRPYQESLKQQTPVIRAYWVRLNVYPRSGTEQKAILSLTAFKRTQRY